jgi:hypothetical protein
VVAVEEIIAVLALVNQEVLVVVERILVALEVRHLQVVKEMLEVLALQLWELEVEVVEQGQ